MAKDISEIIREEREREEAEYQMLKAELETLPQGTLTMKTIKGRDYFYHYFSSKEMPGCTDDRNSRKSDVKGGRESLNTAEAGTPEGSPTGTGLLLSENGETKNERTKKNAGNHRDQRRKKNGNLNSRDAMEGRTFSPGQKYLSLKNTEMIAALIRKQYIKEALPLLESNLRAIVRFQKSFQTLDPTNVYWDLEAVRRMPASVKLALAEDTGRFQRALQKQSSDAREREWAEAPYQKNTMYPEGLIHRTPGGQLVRSKSETVIAGVLEANAVLFRYEAALVIGKHTYFPDFTIYCPKDGSLIYWEHFGMMGEEEYEVSADRKLADYRKNGVVPWSNLITTYDDENGAIDAHVIQKIVRSLIL